MRDAKHEPDVCVCGADVPRGICPCPCSRCQAGRKFDKGLMKCPTCFTGMAPPKGNCPACIRAARASEAARERNAAPATAAKFLEVTGITIKELRAALLAEAKKAKPKERS